MKKKKYIQIVAWFSLLLLTTTGCVKEDVPTEKKETAAIRILTTIEMSVPSPTRAATRAAGTWDESNGTYAEGLEDGSVNESTVGTVRVMAFDNASGEMAANILYVKPGVTPPSADAKNYTFADGTGQNIFKIQMDLQILTGYYEFVLIANEDPSWNLGTIRSRSALTGAPGLKGYLNALVSTTDLENKVAAGSGMPMAGSNYLNVAFVPGTTELNPQLVGPSIELKRTLAKMEVNLTNQDATNGNVVFETANVYQIKSVTLRNANQTYNVLENDAASVTETSYPITQSVNHTTGTPFNGNIFTAYMAERKNATDANAVVADITVVKAGEDITYSIPVYQNPATKDYSIYRNTLYRLNCILKGNALTITLAVLPWELIQSQKEYISEAEMEYASYWTPEPPTVKQPYSAELGATYDVATFTFKMMRPVGGIWTATLTNGLEFAFEPGSSITGAAGTEYNIKVVALKPPTTTTRTTEFYLMVDGVEIDPDNYVLNGQFVEGPVGIGPGNRYVITQTVK
jgi:hypothetical protein